MAFIICAQVFMIGKQQWWDGIYAFLLGFFSSYNQKNVTTKSEYVFKNHKEITQFKHYIAQTSKVQKNNSSKQNKVHSHEMKIS